MLFPSNQDESSYAHRTSGGPIEFLLQIVVEVVLQPGLMSFWAGAIFAFGMVLVRFVYLEDPWQWWPR